jgi:hypothetical protein
LLKAGPKGPAFSFPERDETPETGPFGPILATIPDDGRKLAEVFGYSWPSDKGQRQLRNVSLLVQHVSIPMLKGRKAR